MCHYIVAFPYIRYAHPPKVVTPYKVTFVTRRENNQSPPAQCFSCLQAAWNPGGGRCCTREGRRPTFRRVFVEQTRPFPAENRLVLRRLHLIPSHGLCFA